MNARDVFVLFYITIIIVDYRSFDLRVEKINLLTFLSLNLT